MSSDQPRSAQGDTAIEVASLNKEFRFYDHPTDRLKELLLLDRRRYHKIKRALSDVSFTVRHGEAVGVMGRNGAGKTTLLSILTGTMAPTSGTVDVYGRVGAILGLGVGFLPQYSGRENLRNGLIAMGIASDELKEREEQVVEFSELGDAVDDPLRTYSSGMTARLGFSLAVSSHPDILIVDEALAVGDAAFQHKCQRRIRSFIEQGKTLLFVSHNTGLLQSVCERGILLQHGRVVCSGTIQEAVQRTRLAFFGIDQEAAVSSTERHWGDPDVTLVRAAVANAHHVRDNVYELDQGEVAQLDMVVRTPTPVEHPAFGVIMRDALGKEVCGCSTASFAEPLPAIASGEFSFKIRLQLSVRPGTYTFRIGVSDLSSQPPRLLHAWEEVVAVRVLSAGYVVLGTIDPGIEVEYLGEVYSLPREAGRRRTPGARQGEG